MHGILSWIPITPINQKFGYDYNQLSYVYLQDFPIQMFQTESIIKCYQTVSKKKNFFIDEIQVFTQLLNFLIVKNISSQKQ